MQVLEEGEIFDPDVFLDGLAQQWKQDPSSTAQTSTETFRNPSPPIRGNTEILYSCPVHPNDTLQKKETNTQYGHWEYYKCPVQNCFVSCGVDNVEPYLDSVKRQLHKFYLAKPVHIIKCYCHRPLIMSLSQSEKNPGRLYLKCPKRWCDFFQWLDQEPRGKAKAWMEGGSIQEGYPRPHELFIPQQRDFGRKKAEIREREEKRKRKYAEGQERERQYAEKMRNGNLEERERERVYQQEKKRNGGLINDVMERRRWGLLGSSERNWIWDE